MPKRSESTNELSDELPQSSTNRISAAAAATEAKRRDRIGGAPVPAGDSTTPPSSLAAGAAGPTPTEAAVGGINKDAVETVLREAIRNVLANSLTDVTRRVAERDAQLAQLREDKAQGRGIFATFSSTSSPPTGGSFPNPFPSFPSSSNDILKAASAAAADALKHQNHNHNQSQSMATMGSSVTVSTPTPTDPSPLATATNSMASPPLRSELKSPVVAKDGKEGEGGEAAGTATTPLSPPTVSPRILPKKRRSNNLETVSFGLGTTTSSFGTAQQQQNQQHQSKSSASALFSSASGNTAATTSFGGRSAATTRARSNTFLERQRVGASAVANDPILSQKTAPQRINPSELALGAQEAMAEEVERHVMMSVGGGAGTGMGGGGKYGSGLEERLLGGDDGAINDNDDRRTSFASATSSFGGGGGGNKYTAQKKSFAQVTKNFFGGDDDDNDPTRQSQQSNRSRVTNASMFSPLTEAAVAAMDPKVKVASSNVLYYAGKTNLNHNNTVDSPYPVDDMERRALLFVRAQQQQQGMMMMRNESTLSNNGGENVNASFSSAKNGVGGGVGGSAANFLRYKQRKKSSFAVGAGTRASGAFPRASFNHNGGLAFTSAGGGGASFAFTTAFGKVPKLSWWARLKRKIRDSETYDTDDSIVLLIDGLYVFFTMIATIIVANLLVVYYPNSQNIAPLEDNYSYSFVNLELQPTILSCLQLPFALWMFTRFFVRQRFNELVIIDDVQSLAMCYLSSKSFYWDAFMTVPVEAIFIGSRPESFVVLACRHLFRWFRCVTLLTSSNPFASMRMWYLFYILLFGFICLVHISAVVFPMIQGFTEGDVPFSFPLTYITSLYFIVTTAAGVGYGDAYPTQAYSRSFIIGVQYTGALMFAGLTAYLGHFMLRGDEQRAYMEGLRETIQAMITHYKLPWHVQKDVSLSLQPTLEKHTEIQFFSHLLNQVLPLRLAQEISIFQFAKMYVTSVPCFRGIPNEVALRLAAVSERRYYARNQEIFRMGDDGDALYLILDGLIEIKGMRSSAIVSPPSAEPTAAEGHHHDGDPSSSAAQHHHHHNEQPIAANFGVIATLRMGHHFGLPSIFEPTVRAVTAAPLYKAAEVLVLTRERFHLIYDEYLEVFEDLVDEQRVMLKEVMPLTRQYKYAQKATARAAAAANEPTTTDHHPSGRRDTVPPPAPSSNTTAPSSSQTPSATSSASSPRHQPHRPFDAEEEQEYAKWFFELQTDFPKSMMMGKEDDAEDEA